MGIQYECQKLKSPKYILHKGTLSHLSLYFIEDVKGSTLKFDSYSDSYTEERTEKAVSHSDMEFCATRKQTAGFSSVIVWFLKCKFVPIQHK